jgi:hypothetical protein
MVRATATTIVAVALLAAVVPADQAVRAQAQTPAPAARAPQVTPPCGPGQPASSRSVDASSRCFELRTYTVREGSSIELLHSRFREHTSALFRKHGMTIIGYWQPVSKPDTLVYMLAYRDNAARDAAWAAFNADPEWIKTRTEMAVNVQVDNLFLGATDYSPIK